MSTASFDLHDINGDTIAQLPKIRATASLRDLPADARTPVQRLGVGDRLAIQIWEAASGGLFTASLATDHFSTGARSTVLPEQTIEFDGSVSIPYAGRVAVAGGSLLEAQRRIEKALLGRAIQPQVLVTRVGDATHLVTIMGEVTHASRVSLTTGRLQVLDLLAQAGGLRAGASEAEVDLQVQRQLAIQRVPLQTVLADPRENIALTSGDVVTLVPHRKRFLAYGATGRNAEIPFESAHLSLAQGLAKAGGLLDQRADTHGVFVYRSGEAARTQRPQVYHLDLTTGDGLFHAQQFELQDGDLLYVSNAPMAEAQKALSFMGSILNPAASSASVLAVAKP